MIIGPYLVFQEKHEKEFLCPYELALFKMKAKGKAPGLCFLFLKVGEVSGACLDVFIEMIQKTTLNPAKTS